jgi:hypothetical protein
MFLPQTKDGWEIFFAFLPRYIDGEFVWLRTAERYVEGCNYGDFYVYRLRGSKKKKIRESWEQEDQRTVLDDLAEIAGEP